MRPIRVGFIGAGVISTLHARAYDDIEDAKLTAVCDIDEKAARAKAKAWGVKKVYKDYHELFADADIDAVEILTPQHLHKEMTCAALEAGKHVSVQKPMSVTLSEANEMVAAAQKVSTVARILENFRFYPAIRRAKELIDNDEIGEPLSIRFKLTNGVGGKGDFAHDALSTWDRRMDLDKSGGGAVTFDHGYHLYSLAMHFLGEVEAVFAWIGQKRDASGYVWDSPAMISWKHKGKDKFGVWEQVWGDELWIKTNYYAGEDRMEITGSRGILWVTKCTAEFWDVPPLVMYRHGKVTSFHDLDSDWQASFTAGARHFINSIQGKVKPELTLAEGLEAQRMTIAVKKSGRERRVVYLQEVR